MNSSRDEIRRRIKAAAIPTASPSVGRNVWQPSAMSARERRELFVDRVRDYGALVIVTHPDSAAEALDRILVQERFSSVVSPDSLPASWRPSTIRVQSVASDRELASAEAALTGCALAIAESGTIVMDGGPTQGPRVLTLLPHAHVCIVTEEQIIETMPEAIASLRDRVLIHKVPLTFISGPSATTDIGLVRVTGVHGAQRLIVLVLSQGLG